MRISERFTDEELMVFLYGCRTGEEYWVEHPDYPDVLVSNLGHVRRDGRLLRPNPNSKGYPRVTVGGRNRLVHHLVLETFISHRPPGLETCHWDGKPANARLMNLRWDTHEANGEDRRRHIAERKAWAKFNARPSHLERARAVDRARITKPKRWAEIKRLLQLELESV